MKLGIFEGLTKTLRFSRETVLPLQNKGLLRRRLRLAAIVYSQPSYHRDLAENEKAYLKPVVLNTLT